MIFLGKVEPRRAFLWNGNRSRSVGGVGVTGLIGMSGSEAGKESPIAGENLCSHHLGVVESGSERD